MMVMKSLKEMLTESTINEVKVNLSGDIKDFKAVVMPGRTEMGDFGVIIGEPFTADDKAGRKDAESLVRTLGLKMGNDFDDVIGDFERSGDVDGTVFCYFMTTDDALTVDCYSFGNGGVYIINDK